MFLSRSVNLVELPVEIQPKFSSAARVSGAPHQPIGLALMMTYVQPVYSDAMKFHFQEGQAYPSGWLEVRVFDQEIEA